MSDVTTTLCGFIARYSKVDASGLSAGTRFDKLPGWGSLARLQLLTTTEKHYSIRLDMRQYMDHQTIEELAEQVRTTLD